MSAQTKTSYLCSNSNVPLLYTSLPDLLDERAAGSPDKPAHVFRDVIKTNSMVCDEKLQIARTVLTFKCIADKSLQVAARLLQHGLKPGDRIAALGKNSPEWLYLEYACLRINILLIRIPGALMHHDSFVDVLYKYGCRILFLDHGQVVKDIHKVLPGLLDGHLPEEDHRKLASLQIMFLRAADIEGQQITVTSMSESTCDVAQVAAIQQTLDPDDIAVVLPTSGSTGIPKFCAYSHFKIINGSAAAMTGFDPDAKGYAVVGTDISMTWLGGLHFSPISTGFTFIQIDESIRFMEDATELYFRVLREEEVTSIAVMPFMLYDAVKAHQCGKLTIPASLDNIVTGGERLPQELLSVACTVFKSVLVYYGLTEGYEVFRNKPLIEEGLFTTEMMPYYEAKVTDDSGRMVPQGIPGNLHIRSPFVMTAFLDDPDSSAMVISSSGWLNTGDVATLHEAGYLEIVGRTKDVISCGVRKVYPKTIERVLLKNPKLENAIVIGLPDKRLFQVVCACVIPKSDVQITEDELRNFYTSSTLESIVTPKYFMILDEFPKGATGKFHRQSLVEKAKKHFGL